MPKTTKKKTTKKSCKPRRDAYQEVTDSIVEAFESGDLKKWQRPWKSVGLHKSATTGKDYRGVNQFILFLRSMVQGYESNLWLTYKQAQKMKGNVRKGEKGTQIVFWKFGEVERTNAEGKVITDAKGKPKVDYKLLYAKLYTVFNVDQCENISEDKLAKHKVSETPVEVDGTVEDYLYHTGANIKDGYDQAFYNPGDDFIGMPRRNQFDDAGAYVATVTHELTHWTGHESRLDRDFTGRFNQLAYAAEELVAELGSAFLCAKFGVEGKLQHPQYIKHWVEVMKADKSAIFTAASKAQQAVDFLDKTAADGAEEHAEEIAAMEAGLADIAECAA